jgi:hypothetical protein
MNITEYVAADVTFSLVVNGLIVLELLLTDCLGKGVVIKLLATKDNRTSNSEIKFGI